MPNQAQVISTLDQSHQSDPIEGGWCQGSKIVAICCSCRHFNNQERVKQLSEKAQQELFAVLEKMVPSNCIINPSVHYQPMTVSDLALLRK